MREKCAPNDPHRCQAAVPTGQCPYYAYEDAEMCENHLSDVGVARHKKRKVERYLIEQQDLRMSYLRQQDDHEYLDMKEEILLLQALLEQKINAITNKTELLTAIPGINALVQRLESMKSSLLKMQQELGLVLGKDAIRGLAVEIVNILDEELTGVTDKAERLEKIGTRIVSAIEKAGKSQNPLEE